MRASALWRSTSLNIEFSDRWPRLLDALVRPKHHAVWVNPFAQGGNLDVNAFLFERGFELCPGVAGQAHIWAPSASERANAFSHRTLPKPPTCSKTGLKLYYPLDLASAMPALALIQASHNSQQRVCILDICAAPGGKLLILAGAFFDQKNELGECLVAVDQDKFRLNRLKQNLQLYLPQRVLEKCHPVLGDGTQLTSLSIPKHLKKKQFDAILVDAPCSSERERLLKGGPDIQKAFSIPPAAVHSSVDAFEAQANAVASVLSAPLKVQSNVRRQQALLRACMQHNSEALIVYSTCALSALENDGVITSILRKSFSDWRSLPENVHTANFGIDLTRERRKHGWQVLPDCEGWGPIYWSVLRCTKAGHTMLRDSE